MKCLKKIKKLKNLGLDAFGRGLTIFEYTHIYIYIHLYFFQESILSSFMSVPFHTFRKVSFDHLFLSWLKGLNSPCFSLDSSIILVLSIHAFGKRWMLHVTLFLYNPALPSHSILLGKTTLLLLTPLGGGLFYIYRCIHKFRSIISSIILHVSPTPNFWRMPFDHSFLSEGIVFSFVSLVSSVILHCSINSYFWEGIDYIWIYIYIAIFLSRISSIILHCFINPCFWEGVDFACQIFLLSSCIALSFHTTRKNYLTLIHFFGGIDFFLIYIYRCKHKFLSIISSITLHDLSLPVRISEECHSTTHSFLKGLLCHFFH